MVHADRAREARAVLDLPTELRVLLRHPGEIERVPFPLERHGGRPDAQAEDEAVLAGLDHAFLYEREGAPDRRMPGHRQLLARREDAHADVGARRLGRKDERAFGEVHLARDRLHLVSREPGRFREHRELVAFEGRVGEDVVMKIAVGSH